MGNTIDCDDGNACTVDDCAPENGCVYSFSNDACDDGNVCTQSDQCFNGECMGQEYNCDDGNPCTDDVCVGSDGAPECVYLPIAGACDDDNACTQDDSCDGGLCIGMPITCDDNNSCTLDSCDASSGCLYEPADGAACDDGESCTEGDVCGGGSCQAGPWTVGCCHGPSDCSDNYGCSLETCENGNCVYTPKDCHDGNLCTGDLCAQGVCEHPPLQQEVVLYNENFDAGALQGWHFGINPDGSADIFWSVSDYDSHSGSSSLYVGNPADQTYDHGTGDASAYGPPVQLPDEAEIDLDFYYHAAIQEDGCTYDYLIVEVQETNGERTELVPRICHDTEGFVHKSYVLDSFAGKAVRVILTFKTTDAVNNEDEGFYIDDLSIIALPREGCCASDAHCGDDDLCSADLCQEFECSNPWVPGTYFAESFDSGSILVGGAGQTDKWYINTSADNSEIPITWQVDDSRSWSTPYSLYGGYVKNHNYDAGAFITTARTPKIVLPQDSSAMLTFRLWTDLKQPSCEVDVFRVGASTGVYGNVSWLYTRCNTTEGFINVEVDVSGYSGSNLYLLFQFQANGNKNDAEGVYVDHIRVVKLAEDETCCTGNSDCEDGDLCTINLCTGTPGGGICMDRDVTEYAELFDDEVANGWSYQGAGNNNWQVDDYRHESPKYSLYCGNPQNQTYANSDGGTVMAASPYVVLDDVEKLNPKASYSRYLDLYQPAFNSTPHCLRVLVHQKGMANQTLLEEICSNSDNYEKDTWVYQDWDLDNFMGEEIRLVFVLQYGGIWGPWNIDNEGAYIDNVRIYFEECADDNQG